MAPQKPPIRRAPGALRLAGFPAEPDEQPKASEPTPVTAPAYRSTEDMLRDLETEKKQKRAAAARERRKKQREQIVNIKEVLKISIAQVKAEAAAKAGAEKLPSMNAGAYMPGAPTSRGKIVTGGYDGKKAQSSL